MSVYLGSTQKKFHGGSHGPVLLCLRFHWDPLQSRLQYADTTATALTTLIMIQKQQGITLLVLRIISTPNCIFLSCPCEISSPGSGNQVEKAIDMLTFRAICNHRAWYVECGRVGATQTLSAMFDALHDMTCTAQRRRPVLRTTSLMFSEDAPAYERYP